MQRPSVIGCILSSQPRGSRGLRRAAWVPGGVPDRAPSGPSERPTPQLRDFSKAAAGGEKRRSGTHHCIPRGGADRRQDPVHPGGLISPVSRWRTEGWRHIRPNRALLGGRRGAGLGMSCRGIAGLESTPAAATRWRRPAPPPASSGSAAELERGRRRGRFCWPNCCRRRADGRADAQSRGRRGGARRGGPAPMRRKEKRLLQAVALALAALVLLPNVGLWALYRERQPDGSPGGSGVAVAPAAVQVSGPRPRMGSTLSPSLQFLAPPALRVCSETELPILGMGTLSLWGRSKTYPGSYSSLKQCSALSSFPS